MARVRRAVPFLKKLPPYQAWPKMTRRARSYDQREMRGHWPVGSFGIEKEQPGKPPGKTAVLAAGVDSRPGCLSGEEPGQGPLAAVDLNGLKAEAQEPRGTLVCNSRKIDGA